MALTKKQNKAFRLRPEVVRMIEMAANEMGCSEADVVDRCVVQELANVLRAEMRKPNGIPALIQDVEALKESRELSPREALRRAKKVR